MKIRLLAFVVILGCGATLLLMFLMYLGFWRDTE